MMRRYWSVLTKLFLTFGILALVVWFVQQPILTSLTGFQRKTFSEVRATQDILKILSGDTYDSTTLLVFANQAEQRIGGGFVGSVGLLQGQGGKLKVESIRSIYYYDHRIEGKGIFLEPPEYMKGLVSSIAARDSLLYQEPQENARIFRDLYARESGIYANNVVIITPKVLELLLSYTGPIYLPEYKLTIDKTNILSELQTEIEAGIDKQSGKDPKTILGVLANGILDKLPSLQPEQFVALNRDALQLFANQQAYIYAQDSQLPASIKTAQSGIAAAGDPSTLQVTAANHNATKSTQAIRQKVDAVITINPDGSSQMQVTITRQHMQDYTGKYTDPKSGEQKWLIGEDVSWVQTTLPGGTEILSADGFKVTSQRPFVLGRDMLTQPLSKSQIQFSVKLPQRYELSREIKVRQVLLAQFGWFGQDYSVTVTPPVGYRSVDQTAEKLADGRSVRYTGFEMNDKQFDYVFERTQ